jgi:hypothetical protein
VIGSGVIYVEKPDSKMLTANEAEPILFQHQAG